MGTRTKRLTNLNQNTLETIFAHTDLRGLAALRATRRDFAPVYDALARGAAQRVVAGHLRRRRALTHGNNIKRHNQGGFAHAPNFAETMNTLAVADIIAQLCANPGIGRRIYRRVVQAMIETHANNYGLDQNIIVDHVQFSVETRQFGAMLRDIPEFYPALRIYVFYTACPQHTIHAKAECRVAEVAAVLNGGARVNRNCPAANFKYHANETRTNKQALPFLLLPNGSVVRSDPARRSG